MELEKQVVSLELAKKMKEFGFEQESLFYWEFFAIGDAEGWNLVNEKSPENPHTISAYTCSELGEMIPEIRIDKNPYWGTDPKDSTYWIIPKYHIAEKTLVNAMAKTLIHLKENNLI